LIVLELTVLLIVGVVVVVGMTKVAGPIASAYGERLRIGSNQASPAKLREKIELLEAEVSGLREEVKQLRETAEFATRLLEASAGGEAGGRDEPGGELRQGRPGSA